MIKLMIGMWSGIGMRVKMRMGMNMGRVSKIGIDIKTGMRIGKYDAGVDQGGWARAHQVPPSSLLKLEFH